MAGERANKQEHDEHAVPKQRDSKHEAAAPLPSESVGTTAGFLRLQRLAGNGAVNALLGAGTEPAPTGGLLVSAVDDESEIAADRVAATALQRMGAARTGGAEVRRAAAPAAGGLVGPEGGHAGAEVTQAIRQRQGGGAPLRAPVRERFEGALGAGLDSVRVHTDAGADVLNRQLSARAFTYGSDIFFAKGQYQPESASGQHVLAHELAHTLQTPAVRRRLWDPKTFHKKTDAGLLSGRGKTVTQIEKLLVNYDALTKSGDPKVGAEMDQALTLLDHLIEDIDLWLGTHETDKSRSAKRERPMRELRELARVEMAKFDRIRVAAVGEGKVDAQRTPTENKFKTKLEGHASSILMKAAPIVAAAVPMPGDSAEISIEVKIPVFGPPPVYVGGRLTITADRVIARKADPAKGIKAVDTTAVSFEAAFKSGVTVGAADVGVEIGGYLEAQAKSPKHALQLVSWGWYRTLRESKIIPREVPNLMFGGSTGSVGWKRAEQWSSNVQKENFEGQEIAKNSGVGSSAVADAYVRAGLFGTAAASANIAGKSGVGASAEAEVRLGGGTHWSKDSIEERGRQVGDQEKEGLRGHTEYLGAKFMTLDLSLGASAGPFAGSLDTSVEFLKDKTTRNKLRPTYVQGWMSGSGSIPLNSTTADRVGTYARDLSPRIVEAIRKVGLSAAKKDKTGAPEVVGELMVAGEDITTALGNLSGVTEGEALKSITEQATFSEGEEAFVVGGSPGETMTHGVEAPDDPVGTFGMESEGGLTLSVGFGIQIDYQTGKRKVAGVNVDVALSHDKGTELTASGIGGVSISRSRRILRLQYEKGRTMGTGAWWAD